MTDKTPKPTKTETGITFDNGLKTGITLVNGLKKGAKIETDDESK